MISLSRAVGATLLVVSLLVVCQARGENQPTASAGEKVYLKYKYAKGDAIHVKVVHRSSIKTSHQGQTQTAQAITVSQMIVNVTDVDSDGNLTLENQIDAVDMRHQLTGRAEVRYNSQSQEDPPPGFEDVAKSIGRPLTRLKVTPAGKILDRTELYPQPNSNKGQLLPLLPEGPVSVGYVWNVPQDVTVKLKSGQKKKVETRDRHELIKVADGVATIKTETQVLTPLNNPELEVQVIQRFSNGTLQFDIAKGRLLRRQIDLDKRIINPYGQGSFLHHVAQLVEEVQAADSPTAAAPTTTEKK